MITKRYKNYKSKNPIETITLIRSQLNKLIVR